MMGDLGDMFGHVLGIAFSPSVKPRKRQAFADFEARV
jgi:hypothetical protein